MGGHAVCRCLFSFITKDQPPTPRGRLVGAVACRGLSLCQLMAAPLQLHQSRIVIGLFGTVVPKTVDIVFSICLETDK